MADAVAPHLPNPGTAGQLAFLGIVSIPLATLAVQAASPAHRLGLRLLPVAAAGIAVAALGIHLGHPATLPTMAKLVAAACIGMMLALMLQTGIEVAAIAVVIAIVDGYSVAVGPTHEIVNHHPGLLDDVALNLRVPGSYAVAQIGSSDFVFFALFAAATARLGLRRWADLGGHDGVLRRDHHPGRSVRCGVARPAAALAGLSGGKRGSVVATARGTTVSPERECALTPWGVDIP